MASALDFQVDRKRGKELFEEGIVLCRKLGYVRTLARNLFSLGFVLLLEGDYERGAALIEEAVALYRERGYKGGLEYAVDNLGWAALLQGDHERARSYYRESLMLCKELGNKIVASESLEGLASPIIPAKARIHFTRRSASPTTSIPFGKDSHSMAIPGKGRPLRCVHDVSGGERQGGKG